MPVMETITYENWLKTPSATRLKPCVITGCTALKRLPPLRFEDIKYGDPHFCVPKKALVDILQNVIGLKLNKCCAPRIICNKKGHVTGSHYDFNCRGIFSLHLSGKKLWILREASRIHSEQCSPFKNFPGEQFRDSKHDLEYISSPGDILFLPPLCLHYVQYFEDCLNIDISFVNLIKNDNGLFRRQICVNLLVQKRFDIMKRFDKGLRWADEEWDDYYADSNDDNILAELNDLGAFQIANTIFGELVKRGGFSKFYSVFFQPITRFIRQFFSSKYICLDPEFASIQDSKPEADIMKKFSTLGCYNEYVTSISSGHS